MKCVSVTYLLTTSKPTIPIKINNAKNILDIDSVSSKKHSPMTKVPMAPNPVQTI